MLKALKPSFKQVSWNTNSCFNAKIDIGDNLSNAWHYHPEVELNLIKRSGGTRIVGNSVESFGHNDLTLIGKNTPHAFLHEEKYQDAKDKPQAMVIQFNENFLGNEFLNLPALRDVHELLVKARHGLSITDSGKKCIMPLVERIFRVPSFDGIILLLEILKKITVEGSHRVLVSNKFHSYLSNAADDERFNSILDYTYANYDEHISICDVAKLANLTKESFCRYFKTRVNKTYVEFLTEYRINRACQMIRDGKKSIKEIGYSCGFDSLSNFYYQFKKITKLSPLEFNSQQAYRTKK